MKKDIHPTYYEEATVICACGNTWKTGSTREEIRTDVCSKCHPFYTGEQRIVDTEGQVDRFYKKLQAREEYLEVKQTRVEEKTSPNVDIAEFEISKRAASMLKKAGIETAGDFLTKLVLGDEALLDIDGFGRKSLADLKRSMKRQGYKLPEVETE
ncbi:MAG: 50S ribosomal protein L31 [Anaerolineales bacterium]|nr:50S ribosomal protein L31 [Anaerolineales bacterium]